ncbi:MAG: phospholipase D-like domain-containing protein [Candidatus Helarchaeota archaeon]
MDELFSGIEIAKKVTELILEAENYIYIMQFLLFDIESIQDGNENVNINLIDNLERKNQENIEIKIIISHPRKLSPEIQSRQYQSIEKLALHSIPLLLCEQVHHKFMIVDEKLLHGSANFTFTGLSGKRDELVLTRNMDLIKQFQTLFLTRWMQKDETCVKCGKKCKKFN